MFVGRMFLLAVFAIPLYANAGESSNISKIDLMTVGSTYARIHLESMKAVLIRRNMRWIFPVVNTKRCIPLCLQRRRNSKMSL